MVFRLLFQTVAAPTLHPSSAARFTAPEVLDSGLMDDIVEGVSLRVYAAHFGS